MDEFVPAHGDLPAYTRRLSLRAKQVRLKVTAREGLVVVVPQALSDYDPADALCDRADWIAAALAEFADRRAALSAAPAEKLPVQITLAATGERWPVTYRDTPARSARADVAGSAIVVGGAADDPSSRIRALQRWLQRAARSRLLPILAAEADRTGVEVRSAGIRGQRERWGGCSERGAITLNRCLLFLPPHLVRAVVLHELAHVAHPNHSAAFRAELSRLDPDADRHHAELAAARDLVPPWAEP